jgi:dethiobiotin synthetase
VRRIVLLGTGTHVGKTHAGVLVTRRMRAAGYTVLSLKPVESGCEGGRAPDAAALASAAGHPPPDGSWKFAEPLSPHLAARRAGVTLDLTELAGWIRDAAANADPPPSHVLVETAGGVFSPLTEHATNFDLAQALEPAFWILVAHDSLGTLHDTTAALTAMAASGRRPDAVVLSAARPDDASSGLNAAELERLGVARVTTIARGGQPSLGELIDALARR